MLSTRLSLRTKKFHYVSGCMNCMGDSICMCCSCIWSSPVYRSEHFESIVHMLAVLVILSARTVVMVDGCLSISGSMLESPISLGV